MTTTPPLSDAARVREYVAAHPEGSDTSMMAAALGLTTTKAAQCLVSEMNKRFPSVRREKKVGSNQFTYYPQAVPEEPQPRRRKTGRQDPAALLEERTTPDAETEAPATPEPLDINALADQMALVFARHVATRIGVHLGAILQELIPTDLPPLPARISVADLAAHCVAPAVEKARLPSVLIAGLLPAQARVIEGAFGSVFDLRFFMSDANLQKLWPMAEQAEHVITFTSKISHAIEQVITSSGTKVIRCSGGMTMLKRLLLKLQEGE